MQLENGAMQPLPLALVAPHQAGVADNVSSEDRRQFSLLTGKWNLPALLQRIARGLDRHVRFGVSRVGLTSCPSRPLYPEHRTFPDAVGTSHLCQDRTLLALLRGWDRPTRTINIAAPI